MYLYFVFYLLLYIFVFFFFFFFQAEDGIRDGTVTGVQTCALPIWPYIEQTFGEMKVKGRAMMENPDPVIAKRGKEMVDAASRSEERRVGKECRSRWSPYH